MNKLYQICVGVVIASVTDVSLNLVGAFFAASGVIVTSYYQIWVGTRQKELEVNSMQLLYYQAPLSFVMLIPLTPILDDMLTPGKGVLYFPWSTTSIAVILLSGVLAFLVNLSIFLIIGKTSTVTYNVVGHFKTCCVLVLGFFVFQYPLHYKNILGILITLAGVFIYTGIKLSAPAPTPASVLRSSTSSPPDTPRRSKSPARRASLGSAFSPPTSPKLATSPSHVDAQDSKKRLLRDPDLEDGAG